MDYRDVVEDLECLMEDYPQYSVRVLAREGDGFEFVLKDAKQYKVLSQGQGASIESIPQHIYDVIQSQIERESVPPHFCQYDPSEHFCSVKFASNFLGIEHLQLKDLVDSGYLLCRLVSDHLPLIWKPSLFEFTDYLKNS
jgi:hypothetical protein